MEEFVVYNSRDLCERIFLFESIQILPRNEFPETCQRPVSRVWDEVTKKPRIRRVTRTYLLFVLLCPNALIILTTVSIDKFEVISYFTYRFE